MDEEQLKFRTAHQYLDLLEKSKQLLTDGRYFCHILQGWLDEDLWRKHYDLNRDVWHECATFSEFMEKSPAAGLGLEASKAITDLEQLSRAGVDGADRIMSAWIEADAEGGQMALRAHGGDRRAQGDIVTLNHDRGNSQTYTLRRLGRDRPDLLEKVKTGDLTANSAAIQAGFRKITVQITDADPQAAAQRIRSRLGEDFANALREALS